MLLQQWYTSHHVTDFWYKAYQHAGKRQAANAAAAAAAAAAVSSMQLARHASWTPPTVGFNPFKQHLLRDPLAPPPSPPPPGSTRTSTPSFTGAIQALQTYLPDGASVLKPRALAAAAARRSGSETGSAVSDWSDLDREEFRHMRVRRHTHPAVCCHRLCQSRNSWFQAAEFMRSLHFARRPADGHAPTSVVRRPPLCVPTQCDIAAAALACQLHRSSTHVDGDAQPLRGLAQRGWCRRSCRHRHTKRRRRGAPWGSATACWAATRARRSWTPILCTIAWTSSCRGSLCTMPVHERRGTTTQTRRRCHLRWSHGSAHTSARRQRRGRACRCSARCHGSGRSASARPCTPLWTTAPQIGSARQQAGRGQSDIRHT